MQVSGYRSQYNSEDTCIRIQDDTGLRIQVLGYRAKDTGLGIQVSGYRA